MFNVIAASGSGIGDAYKAFVNFLCQPAYFLTLSTVVFIVMLVAYKHWTKPKVAGILFLLWYIMPRAMFDRKIEAAAS